MSIQSDYSASLEFLRWLYPTGPWMLTAISVDKKQIESRTFAAAEEEAVRAWLAAHDKWNQYYSVNEMTPEAVGKKKLSKTDVLRAHFVHVDVDPRPVESIEELQAEQERIHSKLTSYAIPPSAIVFSGGGYNALWRLSRPVDLASGSPSPEETIARAIDFERRNWQMELAAGYSMMLGDRHVAELRTKLSIAANKIAESIDGLSQRFELIFDELRREAGGAS